MHAAWAPITSLQSTNALHVKCFLALKEKNDTQVYSGMGPVVTEHVHFWYVEKTVYFRSVNLVTIIRSDGIKIDIPVSGGQWH